VIGGNAPAIEDMNAVLFVYAYQLAYIMQAGLPEWDSGTTYYTGSFANVAGVFYVSTTDANVGNNPTADLINWKKIGGDIMSALGDLVYGGTSGTPTRLAPNTSATPAMLTQTGDGVGSSAAPVWRPIKSPTVQKFLSGSGTYTTPAGVQYIRVRMVGGGGGGAGSGSVSGSSPSAGGNSSFGTSLLTANGGGVNASIGGTGGAGGTASLGTGPIGLAYTGSSGGGGSGNITVNSAALAGPSGGSSPFGGGGTSGVGSGAGAGGSAIANTGSGGGGGSMSATANVYTGPAGGAGGFVDAMITSPASTYLYAVGAGGAGGGAGTNGFAGGAGGAGVIIVEEFYQ
jgi:hypothetical protein